MNGRSTLRPPAFSPDAYGMTTPNAATSFQSIALTKQFWPNAWMVRFPYDRIAGYFRSSLFEVAGDDLESRRTSANNLQFRP